MSIFTDITKELDANATFTNKGGTRKTNSIVDIRKLIAKDIDATISFIESGYKDKGKGYKAMFALNGAKASVGIKWGIAYLDLFEDGNNRTNIKRDVIADWYRLAKEAIVNGDADKAINNAMDAAKKRGAKAAATRAANKAA